MPRSKSPNGFRSGRKLRKSPGRTLIVSESFFRPGSSERLRCYFDCHSIALPGTLGLLHQTVKSGNYSSRKRWTRRLRRVSEPGEAAMAPLLLAPLSGKIGGALASTHRL